MYQLHKKYKTWNLDCGDFGRIVQQKSKGDNSRAWGIAGKEHLRWVSMFSDFGLIVRERSKVN